jgi:HEAT repeat protein
MYTKNSAIYLLSEKGNKEGTKKIIDLLANDKEPSVRAAAALALGKLKTMEAENVLISKINDIDWNVRVCVVKALGELQSKNALKPLKDLYKKDRFYGVRLSIVEALGNITEITSVNILVEALKDDNAVIRKKAIEKLKNISYSKEAIILPICELLKDSDVSVRKEAAITLGEFRDKRALVPLQQAAVDKKNTNIKEAILKAINNLK